ncbi:hypothetical protein IGI96_002909 [Enterococcus sp. DIV0421]|uniref:hypothetical protein n=1 Tax=Enterococcus sp. DIV0421 TaxID=2774688 RepID=UPI003F21A026
MSLIIDDTLQKEEKQKRKKKKVYERIPNSVLKMMNHIAFLEEDCITTRQGFTDYVLLENHPIRKEAPAIQQQGIQSYVDFFRGVTSDIKLIFMGYSADTTYQIETIFERFPKDGNACLRQQRDHKVWELEKSQSILEDIVYVQFFGDTREELEQVRSEIMNGTSKMIRIHPITVSQKKSLLYQLYNLGEQPPVFDDSLSDPDLLNHAGEDRKFMSEIMPQTGISSKGNWFTKTGSGYIGVSHLYRYAKKEHFYWGEQVFRQPGALTTVDISHRGLTKIRKELNRSIGDNEDNIRKGLTRDAQMKAQIEYQLLSELLESMVTSNESVKETTTRYYLSGKTKELVWEKQESINQQLSPRGYKTSFFLGEENTELLALYCSHKEQKQMKNRQGKELTTTDLGASYPLNHSQLIDPRGLYFGRTFTGGLVILDMWHKDYRRLSYNFVLLGLPGSGKSSTLKKIGSHNHLLGNYTYYFMANAENDRFMNAYGGVSIDASGRDGTVNPFQIFATVIHELTGEIDEQESYNVSKNKIKTIYSNIYGQNDPDLNHGLDKYIDVFYQEWFSTHDMVLEKATQYANDAYPLLEDFALFIQEKLYDGQGQVRSELSSFEANRLDKMDTVNQAMLNSDPQIFNRPTSLQLGDYYSVSFDLGSLLNKGKAVFNAQFYNLLFLVWNLSMTRGMREKYFVDNHLKRPDEAIRSLLIIDEFHNITRQENMDAIDLLDRYEREARKAFGGFGLATHDISDLFSEGASDSFRDKVRKLLKLSTYIFVMQQDPSSQEELRRSFKETLRASELEQIPHLKQGETILAIKGKGNLQLKIDLSKEEIELFTGGH